VELATSVQRPIRRYAGAPTQLRRARAELGHDGTRGVADRVCRTRHVQRKAPVLRAADPRGNGPGTGRPAKYGQRSQRGYRRTDSGAGRCVAVAEGYVERNGADLPNLVPLQGQRRRADVASLRGQVPGRCPGVPCRRGGGPRLGASTPQELACPPGPPSHTGPYDFHGHTLHGITSMQSPKGPIDRRPEGDVPPRVFV